MQSKSPSRLAVLFLAILPSVAFSACAVVPQAAAIHGALDAREGGPDFACRSARQTAEIYKQMQASDGGIPYAVPSECEPGSTAQKRRESPRAEAPARTGSAIVRALPEGSFDHSPG